MMPYERFDAWKYSHQLAMDFYRHSRTFPASERFGITAQARRAAFSAPANIVEGSAKRGSKEFRRFLDIALASLVEFGYRLRVVTELGFLDQEVARGLEALRQRAARVTWGLYRSLGARSPR